MSPWNRSIYNALPLEEKERLLWELAARHPQFAFVEMKRYEAFGRSTDTALFRHEDGGEFPAGGDLFSGLPR